MHSAISAAAQAAPGVLLVMNDILDAYAEEFHRWYQQQHLPERLAVPGFRTARRYRAVQGGPAFMAVYECASVDVLASAPYLERLANPTDWTRKMMPGFRNMLRSACRQTWSTGDGVGGGAIVVQCKHGTDRQDTARNFIQQRLAPQLMQSPQLLRMALWEADASATGGPSPEMALRGGADKSADWVLFIESCDLARATPALQACLPADAMREAGLLVDAVGAYQLICMRQAPDQS